VQYRVLNAFIMPASFTRPRYLQNFTAGRGCFISETIPEAGTLVTNMLETMYEAPGIGLAATQVNVHERLVVIDVSEESDTPLVLINPEVLESEGEQEMQEGCLSIPGIYETIKRSANIRIAAIDRHGEPYEMDADGLLAVCILHEIDHLDGKLFVAKAGAF